MQNSLENPMLSPSIGLPAKQGLYDPRFEHDACGIGFVAHVEGRRSHRVLQMGLEALANHAHRGAVADDRKTGDGAGILTQLPYEFFNRELRRMGCEPPPAGDLAVGQLYLFRQDEADRQRAKQVIHEVCAEFHLEVLTFRSVPVIDAALGRRAESTRPWMEQVFIRRTPAACAAGDEFERLLYLVRKTIVNRAQKSPAEGGVQRLYIASLSNRTIVYKGLVLAQELAHFYPDLSDEDFQTAIAVFHQRYSTNTLPAWELAQPFRLLCHNGEINTVQGNENWMRAREQELAHPVWRGNEALLRPVLWRKSSDSGKLDNGLELLVRSGRDIRHALLMMPKAWEHKESGVTAERRAFYEYHSALMEPWDGPAAVTFTDGRLVGTILDRNGLRPARYVVLDNGYVISASEAGVVAYDESRVIEKGRLGPGQIFCIDTARGLILKDNEITQHFATRRPYDRWVKENLVSLTERVAGQADTNYESRITNYELHNPLPQRQIAFGYTSEELVVVLRPMITEAKEAVGSMGDDTPPPGMSLLPRPLFHYFKQRFAEVTNPPIDSLREEMVMSLRMLLGQRANLLTELPEATRLIELKSPILKPAEMELLRAMPEPEFRAATIDACWERQPPSNSPQPGGRADDGEGDGVALRKATERLCLAAEEAVRAGVRLLVLSATQILRKISISAMTMRNVRS